jgi:hypothetical protein
MVMLRSGIAAVFLAILALAASSRTQTPLTKIHSDSLEPLKREFNAASDRVRVILLLSPT